jgi:hypothetical protein
VDKKQLDEYKDQLLQRYGEFKAVDKATDKELIKGILVKGGQRGE